MDHPFLSQTGPGIDYFKPPPFIGLPPLNTNAALMSILDRMYSEVLGHSVHQLPIILNE